MYVKIVICDDILVTVQLFQYSTRDRIVSCILMSAGTAAVSL